MTLPQILGDLMRLLFDLAAPAATCTLALAGIALRQEGGANFEAGGKFQRWIIWSVILLTLPQFLSWFLAQGGISIPPQAPAPSPWLGAVEKSFDAFVSGVLIAKLLPVLAAYFVLKAALDASQGHSALGSVLTAMFLLSVSGTVKLMQGWNDGTQLATVSVLSSLWDYVAGTILPEAAGLAVVGAILNYSRQRPFMPLVGTALAFLSVSGLWQLVQVMVR
jgi:hypothetical protein